MKNRTMGQAMFSADEGDWWFVVVRRAFIGVLLLLVLSASAHAAVAYLVGQEVTGMTRQCYYEALGSRYTITIGASQLCPLTIDI